MNKLEYDAVVIGGGFFGCKISCYLKKYLKRILIIEKEADLLQHASYANQARVHNGYHYPRSILTALRSRVNFPKFINEYRECIYSDFDKYYAIGKIFSKVTANQFRIFCQRIDAPLEPAPREVKKLFNANLIEEVFWTKEYAFDAVKLRDRMFNELEEAGVEVKLNSQVVKIKKIAEDLGIEVFFNSSDSCNSIAFNSSDSCNSIAAKHVFNCTYSAINKIIFSSELPSIPLKHELAEMALIEVPEPLKRWGITIMCGPFFSIMPFPARGLHTLSHVRYTPHYYWRDPENFSIESGKNSSKVARKTNYAHMIGDAQRYIPILKDCRYIDSLWEIKTVLPQNEIDDSRPILFKRNQGIKNFTCVLGGKIDNVYDIPDELQFLNSEET